MDKKLSVIIPTYNEGDNIDLLVTRIRAALEGISYEILFVDDSTDNTPSIIEDKMKNHSEIRMIHRENERGLATAVVEGFRAASGDYYVVMDADLQHPPEILPQMYHVIEQGYDFCIPSRFIKGGSDGGLNIWRKFVSWTARMIGKVYLKSLRGLSDATSGLFMFKSECIKNCQLDPQGWKIMVEVLALAEYTSVAEIPYSFCERNQGESKLDSKVSYEYIKQLIALRKREIRRKVTVKRYEQQEIM